MTTPERPAPWQRLHPRMLLVHPLQEVVRTWPVLLGVLVAGTASGGGGWQVLAVVVPVVIGVLRYVTTTYRITDRRIELRRGLVERHVLSVAIDRVRTVDLTASLAHRLLGVVSVEVGTGTGSTDGDEQLELDGLAAVRARALRDELLGEHRHDPEGDRRQDDPPRPAEVVPPTLVLNPTWARFAPLTSTGVALLAGLVGVATQLLDGLGGLDDLDAPSWAGRATGVPFAVVLPSAVALLLLATAALAVGGYLVAYWGYALTHADRAWHLRRGLLTTRETTLADERVAGVTVGEPLGLRLAGGARLTAIATGLRGEDSSAALTPPAPRAVVAAAARAVLGADGPVDDGLVHHGPAAVRRRWTRALGPALAVAAACVALAPRSAWWLLPAVVAPVVAALLAADRARALGHTLVDGHLVSRSGSLNRHRDALATDAVIGWNLRSTPFQRRAGLVTLVATTAGGRQSVPVPDVPAERAVALAVAAVPGLLEQVLVPPTVSRAGAPAGAPDHAP